METYLHNIEYLVKDPEEIDNLKKIIEGLPIDIPFHTEIVLEPNRLPKDSFPYEIIIYLDRGLERLNFEEYEELKQKYDSGESNLKIRACADKIDQKLLLQKVETTDGSCKILPSRCPEGIIVVYGNKESPKRVCITFWESAHSEFFQF